jgi:hypothetical protein
MSKGKSFNDFIAASLPHIGPMFAPAWEDLPSDPLDVGWNPQRPLVEDLFRAAYSNTVIALGGSDGIPVEEIAAAFCAFWGIPPKAYYTSISSTMPSWDSTELFCESEEPVCVLVHQDDLYERSVEQRHKLVRACDAHIKR